MTTDAMTTVTTGEFWTCLLHLGALLAEIRGETAGTA